MSPDLPPHRPREAAVYIAEFASDLARLARESGLLELAHLLDMARLEAEMVAMMQPREPGPANSASLTRHGRCPTQPRLVATGPVIGALAVG
jgi:hypothetical protein